MPTVVVVLATLVLACCARCGRRVRLLPLGILPHKRLGLAVIECLVTAYAKGSRSLRQVAWGPHARAVALVHAQSPPP